MKVFLKLICFACILVCCIEADADAEPRFELILANAKSVEATGNLFTLVDLLEFARTCISAKVAVATIDDELINQSESRILLDDFSFHCLPYFSTDSSSATSQLSPTCLIENVSPGTTILISDCSSSCVGDQFLRLVDADNKEVASNDDGKCEAPLNLCSSFQYTNTNTTSQSYELVEGCFENQSCSGQIKVTYSSTSSPTIWPTVSPSSTTPSSNPTASQTISLPTSFPSAGSIAIDISPTLQRCLFYSTSNTNYAKTNTATCVIPNVCPGTYLRISDCDENSCVGDQYIRLYDENNILVMYDDDGCDINPVATCSSLTYTHKGNTCQNFFLQQGCYNDETCSGVMDVYYVTTDAPTMLPSASPSASSSASPIIFPTVVPSSKSTSFPSFEPSYLPTASPSYSPSLEPSDTPSLNPTLSPTMTLKAFFDCSTTSSDVIVKTVPSGLPNVNIHLKVRCNRSPTDQNYYYYFPTCGPSSLPSISFIPSMTPTMDPTYEPSSESPTVRPSRSGIKD